MLILSLKGNPVRIGDGPAAVIPPFIVQEGNPFSRVCHCLENNSDGKAAERAGKSEDLPEHKAFTFGERGVP